MFWVRTIPHNDCDARNYQRNRQNGVRPSAYPPRTWLCREFGIRDQPADTELSQGGASASSRSSSRTGGLREPRGGLFPAPARLDTINKKSRPDRSGRLS
jgi:hypothetical protein